MRKGSPSLGTVVLEQLHVAEAPILGQAAKPMYISLHHELHLFLGELIQVMGMVRRVDDHLVSPHPVHPEEGPLRSGVQGGVVREGWELVWHHPDPPVAGRDPVDLRRGHVFVSRTKWALSPSLDLRGTFGPEIQRALSPLRGDDDPAPQKRAFPKLRHPPRLPLS